MNIQWSKNNLLNWTGTCKNTKLDYQLAPHTRINSKRIKDLDISCDTIKVVVENIGSKTSDILCSNIFADISLRVTEIKEKINKWDYIKFKSFCTA